MSSYGMSEPLFNRFAHVYIETKVEEAVLGNPYIIVPSPAHKSRKEFFEFIMPKHKSTTDFSKFVKEFTQKYMNKKTFKVIVK